MSNFLKMACSISAANYARLAISTDKSRTKVVALAIALLVPVLIWTVCGFMLPFGIMGKGLWVSILSALVIGLIVFTIERLVLISNGHWAVAIFRILLAGTVAWLGAIFIDQVIFKDDIDHVMPQLQHQEALKAQRMVAQQFAERNNMAVLDKAVTANYAEFNDRQNDAVQEAGGLAGSGIKGAASATNFKQGIANSALARYHSNKNLLDALQHRSGDIQTAAYDSASAHFNNHSLLYRIKAMHLLLDEHSEMAGIYWAVTVFLFMLEFLVLIFKLTWPKTAYELETEMLDDLHKQRTNRMKPMSTAMQQAHLVEPTLKQKSLQLSSRLNSII